METIHHATAAAVLADGQFINYIKKIQPKAKAVPKVEAELQQGKFEDVDEIGTSKIKRRLARLKKRNLG